MVLVEMGPSFWYVGHHCAPLFLCLNFANREEQWHWMLFHRSVAVLSVLIFLFSCGLGVCAERQNEIIKVKVGMEAIQSGMAGVWMAKPVCILNRDRCRPLRTGKPGSSAEGDEPHRLGYIHDYL